MRISSQLTVNDGVDVSFANETLEYDKSITEIFEHSFTTKHDERVKGRTMLSVKRGKKWKLKKETERDREREREG